jgi:hypothetical protein
VGKLEDHATRQARPIASQMDSENLPRSKA